MFCMIMTFKELTLACDLMFESQLLLFQNYQEFTVILHLLRNSHW